MDKLSYLSKKSVETYKEEGFISLVRKSSRYVLNQIQPKFLFEPLVPPIELGIGTKRVMIGGRKKYIMDEMKPDKSDTVVAVGAYHGKDTAMFGKLAKEVIAFEPSPRNYNVAEKNLSRFSNITLLNRGLWNEKDELKIKYGEGSGDDGFLEPDSGLSEETVEKEVPVNTVENYMEELGVENVDYLKVEAEGAEPEIIEGLGDLRIQNIAVNVGEERDGETTGNEVVEILNQKGYTLLGLKRGHIIFLTLDEVDFTAFSEL